ncbi:MAG: hypothetical protein J5827_00795 [Oscillospiraceae bacterium]|nr:hypothetical protein [Oscillospiraceae bacterium]
MKQLICIILAVIFAAALCSCGSLAGGPASAPSDPKEAAGVPSETPENGASPAADTTPAAASSPDLITAQTDKEEKDAPEDPLWSGDTLFSFGAIDGDIYENPYLGYGCKLENWSFADESRLAELNNLGEELLNSDFQSAIRDSDIIFEMYAESEDGLQNAAIQFQKTEILDGERLSDEEIMEMMISVMAPAFEAQGYDDLTLKITTVPLDGDEHCGIEIKGEFYGIPLYQKEVMVRCGEHCAFITVTGVVDDTVDEVFERFYRLT